MVRAGVKILQIRVKNQSKKRIYEITREIVSFCAQNGVCCIVNDYVDIALTTAASGVHLGQTDFPLSEARALLPGRVIGFSTHDGEQFAAAKTRPVDYIAIGPVFQTASKINAAEPLGLPIVRKIVKGKTQPIVAIGGIDQQHIAQLIDAGVDGIAMISSLYRDGTVYDNTCRLMGIVRAKV